jgi:uncharacterized protein (TIGR03435 family)
MLQNLLAERFKLKAHREDGTVNGFNLTVDKGGSRLKPSEAPGIGFGVMVLDRIQGSGDMAKLVSALSGRLRAPVEDRTGIAGSYDIDLKWTPDPADASADEPALSIFTAIRQMGLSLETTKVSIDKFVIDRVERPTETELLDPLVLFHLAVADVNDAVGMHGDIVLVGHQHDGIPLLVQPFEQRHDFVAGG